MAKKLLLSAVAFAASVDFLQRKILRPVRPSSDNAPPVMTLARKQRTRSVQY